MSIANSFCSSGFAGFINSRAGRIARVLVGVALIGWGYSLRAETTGVVLMVVGLLPLLTGTLDLCVISALLGGPLSGSELRKLSAKV